MGDELDIQFTEEDLRILSEVDSCQFGFIILNKNEHARTKELVTKAIGYLNRMLVQAQSQKEKGILLDKPANDAGFDVDKEITVDPKTYCKLGHFHLLLEEYSEALSAYQKYYQLFSKHWKDIEFLYGLGLVYYHFNAFRPAVKTFLNVLYLDPSFCRANEIHLRLGLMLKITNDWNESMKHLQMTKLDVSPCTFSKLEIDFHIAHLYELQGKHTKAKELFEKLLKEKDLPPNLYAEICRELGWLYHSVESFGEKHFRESEAIHYLEKSSEAEKKSGQALYLMGRCHASVGKVHDAFQAYRQSVDKSEGNADTWCSIGVLYHQQKQHMDALQAYICAVQLCKNHSAAWMNLGRRRKKYNNQKDPKSSQREKKSKIRQS